MVMRAHAVPHPKIFRASSVLQGGVSETPEDEFAERAGFGCPHKERAPELCARFQIYAERRLSETYRYEADVRSQEHGRNTSFLLSKAQTWGDDGLSPKALQRRYGRGITARASENFVSELIRKAE